MNRKQRLKNKKTAQWLRYQRICTMCGEKGLHYVSIPMSLEDIINGVPNQGFWTCKGNTK